MHKDEILFSKNSEFDTLKVFGEDFPMFKENRRSIPTFIIPNTVNGACVIFSTLDKSQFIYRMCNHDVILLGPSMEFLENVCKDNKLNVGWILDNIIKDDSISSYFKKDEDTYEFAYNGNKYLVTGSYTPDADGSTVQLYSRCHLSISLIK